MFLLILYLLPTSCYQVILFTFHYVSINTTCITFLYLVGFAFTFHYVSINTTYRWDGLMENHLSLHSTMFLLIQIPFSHLQLFRQPLHSTMFLLIRDLTIKAARMRLNFTFHYVSINTLITSYTKTWSAVFTFHYVSINTRSSEPPINSSILYHILSTMIFFYLFIYFDITRFTGSTILLMFFTFVDLS